MCEETPCASSAAVKIYIDHLMKRLSTLESSVSELRLEMSRVVPLVPYMATKADLSALKAELAVGSGFFASLFKR